MFRLQKLKNKINKNWGKRFGQGKFNELKLLGEKATKFSLEIF